MQELQQKRAQQVADAAEAELESPRQSAVVGRKKPHRISPANRSPASPSNNSPMSPTDVKAKNTGPYGPALFNFRYIVRLGSSLLEDEGTYRNLWKVVFVMCTESQ